MKPPQRGLIFALVGLSLALSGYFAKSGGDGLPHRLEQCLTNPDCQPDERCVVVPKDDGFATMGQCGPLCSDDSTCPNGWNCRAWVEEKGYLSPERGKAAELPRVKVCMHHTVQ